MWAFNVRTYKWYKSMYLLSTMEISFDMFSYDISQVRGWVDLFWWSYCINRFIVWWQLWVYKYFWGVFSWFRFYCVDWLPLVGYCENISVVYNNKYKEWQVSGGTTNRSVLQTSHKISKKQSFFPSLNVLFLKILSLFKTNIIMKNIQLKKKKKKSKEHSIAWAKALSF